MVVLFANQKGGVGKSTLALLFANYLAKAKSEKVEVADMDFQQSIYNKFQAASNLANDPLYQVRAAELVDFKSIHQKVKQEDKILLVDLPGKMDDDNLLPVFRESDLVLCPFAYDEYSVSSTIEFSIVVKAIRKNARIIYLPNRVKTTVKYETRQSVEAALSNFGIVTPAIAERIDFQRITAYETPASIIQVLHPVFEEIYDMAIKETAYGAG